VYKETTVNKVSSTGRAAYFLGEEKELLPMLRDLFTQQKCLSAIPAHLCLESGISAARCLSSQLTTVIRHRYYWACYLWIIQCHYCCVSNTVSHSWQWWAMIWDLQRNHSVSCKGRVI